MKRISVDFNTLNSEPVDLVKLAPVGEELAYDLPALDEGERVVLRDDELEVEAVVVRYHGQHCDYWMAAPDRATWRDVPEVPAADAAGMRR